MLLACMINRISISNFFRDLLGYGFVDYQPPHYGSGYDKYVFGNYEGHAVNVY